MFPSLNAEMARYGIKKKDLAKLLGVTEKTARGKLSGKAYFTSKEMKKIRDGFFPSLTIDYLFFDGSSRSSKVS